jgi:hypothetical protein
MIEMSRDGVFENSRVINLKTREIKDAKDFIKEHEEVLYEINKSDYILKNNMLKEVLNK